MADDLDRPRVSVGMPVYNGEPHLEEAITCHLEQTFGDFELVICDNASTDATEAICRGAARRDDRIRYQRNPVNLGMAANYERCFELSRGELFTWSAADDLCEPEYLEACVDALDADPGTVLAYSPARITDEDLSLVALEPHHPPLESPDPATRFGYIADLHTHLASTIFGVVRREVLAGALPHGRYAGADRVLVATLALRGPFTEVPRGLLTWRRHQDQYTQNYRSSHFATGFWDPTREGVVAFANWRRLGELVRAAWSAPLGAGDRIRALGQLLPWTARHHRRLAYDLVVVPPHRFRSAGRRQAGEATVTEAPSR